VTAGNGARTNGNDRGKLRNGTTRGDFGHVAITGAAGAIGAALARAMRAAWPTVELALVDRDRDALERVAAELRTSTGDATVHVVDLRDIGALPALIATIEQTKPLDGLVNCAGVMWVKQLQTCKWEDASDLLTIDLLAPLRLQDLVVRGMVERGRGLVINVASMAGRVPLKGAAYYGASKAGLAMASEIARADLAQHDVQVITVYPGPVKSPLEAGARADYGGGGLMGKLVPTGDPAELARRIMHAIEHDEPRVIYPRVYGVGWTAPNLSSWLSLSYGPPPVN
jgi:short-subunit dehydrogenase